MINNNIPEEFNQDPQLEDNPDETAAVLSFATYLSEQTMPKPSKMQEKGSTSNENEKGEVDNEKEEKVDLKANNEQMEKNMDSKIEELRKEVKETIKEEIGSIKDIIKEALQEDGEEE